MASTTHTQGTRRAPKWHSDPASAAQIASMEKNITRKQLPEGYGPTLQLIISNHRDGTRPLLKGEASGILDQLFNMPWKSQGATVTTEAKSEPDKLEVGVYETSEGIFVVKPTRDKQRLYAKKLVEINADRLTEDGDTVQIEFEYAKGAIYRLTAADKMPLERAKKLTIRYGKCIVCNRRLKAKQSVEDGIGPVCIKSFR